jgi:hypothetical protein
MVKKIEFTNVKPNISLKDPDFAKQIFMGVIEPEFKMELLEISNVETPSDLTINFQLNKKKYALPLYKRRVDFIFQKDIFVLDISEIQPFKLTDEIDPDFSVKVISEKPFKLTIYFSSGKELGLSNTEYL